MARKIKKLFADFVIKYVLLIFFCNIIYEIQSKIIIFDMFEKNVKEKHENNNKNFYSNKKYFISKFSFDNQFQGDFNSRDYRYMTKSNTILLN